MSKTLTPEMLFIKSKNYNLSTIRQVNFWGASLSDISVISKCASLVSASFSKNQLVTLRPFQNLQNLQELSMASNYISDFNELYYLKSCPHLSSLWLKGNPISQARNYRETVIKVLPNLKKLDDEVITPEEKYAISSDSYQQYKQEKEYNYKEKQAYRYNKGYYEGGLYELEKPKRNKDDDYYRHRNNYYAKNDDYEVQYQLKCPYAQDYYGQDVNNYYLGRPRNIPGSAQPQQRRYSDSKIMRVNRHNYSYGYENDEYYNYEGYNKNKIGLHKSDSTNNERQAVECLNVLLPGLSNDELLYVKDYIDEKINKY